MRDERLFLFQSREIFNQVHEVLLRHGLLEAGGHDGEGGFGSFGDFGFFVVGGNAGGDFENDFVGSFAGNNAGRFVAIFEFNLPGFEAERNAGAWIENGFVDGFPGELGSDFGKGGAEVHAFVIYSVAADAIDFGAAKNFGTVGGIAFEFDEFGDGRKRGVLGLREGENFGGFG